MFFEDNYPFGVVYIFFYVFFFSFVCHFTLGARLCFLGLTIIFSACCWVIFVNNNLFNFMRL